MSDEKRELPISYEQLKLELIKRGRGDIDIESLPVMDVNDMPPEMEKDMREFVSSLFDDVRRVKLDDSRPSLSPVAIAIIKHRMK